LAPAIISKLAVGITAAVVLTALAETQGRIDAYAERLEGNTPGLKLARVDAVRVVLLRGLAQVEEPEASGKKRS
jgi:hypothetical protein